MFKSPLPKFDTDRELRKDLEPQLKHLYGNMALWTKNLQFQNVFTKYLITKYKEVLECDDPKVATQLWDLFVSAFPSLEFEYGSTSKRLATYLDPEEHLVTNKTHVVYGDDKHPKNRYLTQGLENLEAVLFFVNRSHYTAAVRNGDKWYYYDDTKPAIVILKNPEEFIFKENPQKKISLLFYVYF